MPHGPLPLIITRDVDEIACTEPVDSYYVFDHSFVRTSVYLPKPVLETHTVEYRKLKNIDHETFPQDLLNSKLLSERIFQPE